MFNNFTITLIAMFAIILALFRTDIKEGFTTNPFGVPGHDKFGPFNIQTTMVGGTVTHSGGQKLDVPNYKLGYDYSKSFPRGIDTTRNIQTAPPPRFQVTGPKLNHYKPIDMAKYAVDQDQPIAHAADVVHSKFGQLQRDSRKDVKENYNDYESSTVPLPTDMCNVNMLGTETQPVIYDRLMYSNIRSRTRGQGDYIRGDLMIAPDNHKPGGGGHPQWFQVSAKPNRDLNPGCMEHLYGKGEEIALGVAQADIDVASFGL